MSTLKVGDPVVVRDVNMRGSRRSTVTRIGRKYVYLTGGEGPYKPGTEPDTWVRADAYGHQAFRTVEAYELAARLSEIRTTLRDFGIDVSRRVSNAAVLDIAEALKGIVPGLAKEEG